MQKSQRRFIVYLFSISSSAEISSFFDILIGTNCFSLKFHQTQHRRKCQLGHMFFPNNFQSTKFCRNSSNQRRNINFGFPPPPFLMRLCVAKGRAGLKPGGHYQREDDEAEFESTWGCMRRSRGAWEHWKHFTSLVEPQWHSTARGVWKHSGHSVGPELGLMIILQKEKKHTQEKPNVQTANC